jgi:hypothetical protein
MVDQGKAPDSFSGDWCGFAWTSWIPFRANGITKEIVPAQPGLYRIRPAGQKVLMYIGWTGGPLTECFTGIRQNVAKLNMPPDDPWPVAPALWAWKDAKGYQYEFSSAVYGENRVEWQAAACYLTYCYRLEHHESPLCSFGRFHRKYRRASDQPGGEAGGKIGPGEPLNPAGGAGASPLPVTGRPGEPGWMGLSWSPRRSLRTHTTGIVPAQQGYFLIFDAGTGAVLLIRLSEDCARDLFAISRDPWDNRDLAYSFSCEPKPLPVHNLREREGDLIGNFIGQTGTVPEFQFRDGV